MKLFEFLRKSLSEDNGNPSSIRVNIFISLVAFVGSYVSITYTICVYHPELLAMLLETTAVSIGGIIGLKILSKTKEQKMDGVGVNSTSDAVVKTDVPVPTSV